MSEYLHPNKSNLDPTKFEATIDSKPVRLYMLTNSNGLELCVSNYGAIVVSIMAPDQQGNFANVVLGHESIEAIQNSPEPYLGSVIGRYGNRIAKGKFQLCGKQYELATNNGPNNLHGGIKGFHAVVWDAQQIDAQTLVLHYLSKDGEEGFPGNLSVKMTYTLTDNNEFKIEYEAGSDETTVCNLTNHAFFNLAGIANPSPSINNHVVTIHADHFTPMNEVSIPTGEILKVAGTPMDFRTPHAIGERIDCDHEQIKFGSGYDHNFVLNQHEAGELVFAAECVEPNSGRTLKVYTTEPGVQLYTGNWLGGFTGMHGATFPARSALCFETQKFPDTPNRSFFPSATLQPGEKYTHTCIYQFGVISK